LLTRGEIVLYLRIYTTTKLTCENFFGITQTLAITFAAIPSWAEHQTGTGALQEFAIFISANSKLIEIEIRNQFLPGQALAPPEK